METVFGLAAVLAVVPPGLVVLLRPRGVDGTFVAALAAAVAGTLAFAVAQVGWGRLADLSTALWLGVAASLILFACLAFTLREAWRLAPLLSSYLTLVGIAAMLARLAPPSPSPDLSSGWSGAHAAISIATYGLLTLAAVAGLAVFLQESALKTRRPPGALLRALPSAADAEALQLRLLIGSAVVLGAGMLTGSATEYLASGRLLQFEHKTVLSLAAFATILALLAVHYRFGLGGRRAARLVLLAYLLLTLAYPGVKFVSQVLLA